MLERAFNIILLFIVIFLNIFAFNDFSLDLGCDRQESDFYLGGTQVNEYDQTAWCRAVRAAGFNTISVSVEARQLRWDDASLIFLANDDRILNEIRAAKAEGLHVAMVLRVRLAEDDPYNLHLWHGMIYPESDSLVQAWFETYGEFVKKWADIAAQHGVEIFAIGSELNMLSATVAIAQLPPLIEYYLNPQKQQDAQRELRQVSDSEAPADGFFESALKAREAWARQVSWQGDSLSMERINARRATIRGKWQALVANVRKRYTGKLTYAANFDNYQDVAFWQQLDLIGINAYFPLRSEINFANEKALFDSLSVGWQRVFAEIMKFKESQALHDQQVLFTELGYTYRAHSTLQPWNSHGQAVVGTGGNRKLLVWEEQPVDLTERALAVDALYQVHSKYPKKILAGILYWKLSTKRYHMDFEPFMVDIGGADPLLGSLTEFLD